MLLKFFFDQAMKDILTLTNYIETKVFITSLELAFRLYAMCQKWSFSHYDDSDKAMIGFYSNYQFRKLLIHYITDDQLLVILRPWFYERLIGVIKLNLQLSMV